MPTHTIHSAFIKFHFALPGAPFIYATFQDLTGVLHGLFPQDDDKLPTGMTRQQNTQIFSYFEQFNNLRTEDAKMKFAAARKRKDKEDVPGRPLWREWLTPNYARWKIHATVTSLLSEASLHPLQIMIANGDLTTFPASDSYIPNAIDIVGRALFGEEALDKNYRVRMPLRSPLSILIQRSWENLKKQTNRNKERLEKLELGAISAMEALDKDKLTKRKLNTVIRAVARWKALASIFCTEEVLDKIAEMEEELALLMEGLGAKVRSSGKAGRKRVSKVSKEDLSHLASQEDVEDVLHYFEMFFSQDNEEIPDNTLRVEDRLDVDICGNSGADCGTEEEAMLTARAMLANLDFRNANLPFLFNKYRHTSGLTPWEADHTAIFQDENQPEKNPDLAALQLHHHQIMGVHSILRNIFSEEPNADACTGMLVADEVGLGKTFQACTTLAFLGELAMRQKHGKPVPPIIAQRPYLKDQKDLPELPHLIIVPGTLLAQWEHELKIVFKKNSVDIMTYGVTERQRQEFWSEHGVFRASKQPKYLRIILASHSALVSDYSSLYSSEKNPKSLPWETPNRNLNYERLVSNTLFCQEYLSVVFDEAQTIRNPGTGQTAALTLLKQSLIRIILTATPLTTSPKDISSMGRLIGIPYFSTTQLFEDIKQDEADIRRAKSEKLRIEREAAKATDQPQDQANVKDGQCRSPDDRRVEVQCPVKLKQVQISLRMNKQFEGRLIRRTPTSIGPNGKPLLRLPPLDVKHFVVKLTPREMKIIDSVTEINHDAASAANGKNITTKQFYLEHRQGVCFAREDPAEGIPRFESLEQWEKVKSTKIDTCCRLVKHLLSRDDVPEPVFKDGEVVFPDIPEPQPGQDAPKEHKILIYQDFPMFCALLINILSLYGIDALALNGKMKYEQRHEVKRRFDTDPTIRVLIISQVGHFGLNLTVACIGIFMDQLWSAQEERQAIGRLHRQGQLKPVQIYHILAKDTADIVLANLAQGKRQMLEAFLSTDNAKKLMHILSGGMVEEDEDDNDDQEASAQVSSNSRPNPRGKGKPKEKSMTTGSKGKSRSKKSRPTSEVPNVVGGQNSDSVTSGQNEDSSAAGLGKTNDADGHAQDQGKTGLPDASPEETLAVLQNGEEEVEIQQALMETPDVQIEERNLDDQSLADSSLGDVSMGGMSTTDLADSSLGDVSMGGMSTTDQSDLEASRGGYGTGMGVTTEEEGFNLDDERLSDPGENLPPQEEDNVNQTESHSKKRQRSASPPAAELHPLNSGALGSVPPVMEDETSVTAVETAGEKDAPPKGQDGADKDQEISSGKPARKKTRIDQTKEFSPVPGPSPSFRPRASMSSPPRSGWSAASRITPGMARESSQQQAWLKESAKRREEKKSQSASSSQKSNDRVHNTAARKPSIPTHRLPSAFDPPDLGKLPPLQAPKAPNPYFKGNGKSTGKKSTPST